MKNSKMTAVAALVTSGIGGSLLMPLAAQASEAGHKNTTMGLGALAAVLALKGKWLPAAIAGAGAAVAEHNRQGEINTRHRQQRYYGARANVPNGYNGAGVPYGSNGAGSHGAPPEPPAYNAYQGR